VVSLCWKGDYWNLGAGAEIGIYYNNDVQRAEDGYYEIDTENLLVHAIMNVTYDGKYITTNFEQTNWWVTSFTPRIQKPDKNKLFVHLKVNFAGKGNRTGLWTPFYTKWDIEIKAGREKDLSWASPLNLQTFFVDY
jgi:hypothetical protein